MSLHDPVRFADIVRGMIDIQVHEGTYLVFKYKHFLHSDLLYEIGWLPECRGATIQQSVQGGSGMLVLLSMTADILTLLVPTDADPILGEFFVKYVHCFSI